MDLCPRPGRRTDRTGQILAGAAPGANGARRGASFRGDVSPLATGHEPPAQRISADSRRWGKDRVKTPAKFWQPGAGSRRIRGGVGRGSGYEIGAKSSRGSEQNKYVGQS